jgi:hypothetical protein
MAAGITRVNGTAKAESFYGYQPAWYEIAGSGFDTTPTIVDSNFEKAVRAIESLASIVQIGFPGSGGFLVAVDGNTFNGTGNGGTAGVSETGAEALDRVITDATSISTTVTAKAVGKADFSGTGLVFATP